MVVERDDQALVEQPLNPSLLLGAHLDFARRHAIDFARQLELDIVDARCEVLERTVAGVPLSFGAHLPFDGDGVLFSVC